MNFSRKTLIALGVGSAAALVLGLGWYFLFRKVNVPESGGGTLPSSPAGTAQLPVQGAPAGGPNSGGGNQDLPAAVGSHLEQIHDKPIVSFVVFNRNENTFVRFMEQGSGHVYEYDAATKVKVRISNTSIPQIGNAVWSKDGNLVAFQYVDKGVLKTALGELATTSGESSFKKITFMPDGIRSLALSPDGTSVAYVVADVSGAKVMIAKKNGSGSRVVFSSTLTKWLLSWPGTNTLVVETPLSGQGGGASYEVNPATGTKTPLTLSQGKFSGVLVSPDGSAYLSDATWQDGGITRFEVKSRTFFDSFALNTIADKCTFVATSTSVVICGSGKSLSEPIVTDPEGWLRGEFASDDFLALINFKKASWSPLIPPDELGDKAFDVEHIGTNANGSYEVFKEKIGGTLWGVSIDPKLLTN